MPYSQAFTESEIVVIALLQANKIQTIDINTDNLWSLSSSFLFSSAEMCDRHFSDGPKKLKSWIEMEFFVS